MSALLSVQNVSLSFRRGQARVFENLSFDVLPGEVAVIVGDSGSGKTTLLHLIAGFIRKYEPPRTISEYLWRGVFPEPRDISVDGTILIGGKDVGQTAPSQRDIGLVMQRFSLYPNLTVLENISVPLHARGVALDQIEQEARRIADQVHITFPLTRRPNELAGGQQQRVAIGKLLARDPLLALCDEAFSNLDWKLRQTLREEVIHELKRRSKNGVQCGVLFVSHDLEDAKEADRIIYLKRTDEDAHAGRPATFHHFDGGRRVAWDRFCRATDYHVIQLVGLGSVC